MKNLSELRNSLRKVKERLLLDDLTPEEKKDLEKEEAELEQNIRDAENAERAREVVKKIPPPSTPAP